MTKLAEFYEVKGRDDYGRPYVQVTAKLDTRVTGVVVTMPKCYREHYPGEAYLVNDWTKPPTHYNGKTYRNGVTYHAKRAEALNYLREVLTRELEDRKVAA